MNKMKVRMKLEKKYLFFCLIIVVEP